MTFCVFIPVLENLFFYSNTNIVDVNQSSAAAPVNGNSSSGLSQDIIDQIQRPTVDSLLDELSNARSASPVYAIPHESADGKPKSGRHVTITVRETTTERVTGTPSQCKFLFDFCHRRCITSRGEKKPKTFQIEIKNFPCV